MGALVRSGGFSAAVLLACSGVVAAGPSTQEGANRLTAAFQAYLTTTPGVVTVSPTGEAYKVTLDAAPLAAKAGSTAAFTMSPVVMTLTDRGDGSWGVAQDQAFSLDAKLPGKFEVSVRFAGVAMDGVWTEALRSFASYKATLTGIDYITTTFGPEGTPPVRQVQKIDTMLVTGTGAAAAAGGVDVTQTFEAQGLSQSMTMPAMAPGETAQDIGVTAAGYTGRTTAEGLRAAELLDLVAWFVAHPSEAEVVAAQEELRSRATALLPVFGHLAGSFDVSETSVTTPVGTFGLAKLGISVEANGIVQDGMVREAFRFEGIAVPPGLVPDWALPLIPQSGTLDVAGSGFDLAAVAGRVIAAFDLTKDPPVDPAVEAEFGKLILPDGQVRITFAPGNVTGAGYALTWEGAMQVGPGQEIPTGTAKVTAKGLDVVRQALTNAPPDMGGPASMGIGAAVAVGRTEPDGTVVWEIDASLPGQVKINGRAMPMGGP